MSVNQALVNPGNSSVTVPVKNSSDYHQNWKMKSEIILDPVICLFKLSGSRKTCIRIFDINDRIIIDKRENQIQIIDMSSYGQGMYFDFAYDNQCAIELIE